jgi:hypothetical protein
MIGEDRPQEIPHMESHHYLPHYGGFIIADK